MAWLEISLHLLQTLFSKALTAQITLICGDLTCQLMKDGMPRISQMLANLRIPHIDGARHKEDVVSERWSSLALLLRATLQAQLSALRSFSSVLLHRPLARSHTLRPVHPRLIRFSQGTEKCPATS